MYPITKYLKAFFIHRNDWKWSKMVWYYDFYVRKKVCILLLNTTPFFPRPILYTYRNDWKSSTLIWNYDFDVRKKGVYAITKYHTFFPRPIFDRELIENDLQWFRSTNFRSEKKVWYLVFISILNTTPQHTYTHLYTPFFLGFIWHFSWLKSLQNDLKLYVWWIQYM